MKEKIQKIYAYVDESGQDTKGEIFLVSVVIVSSQRDELRKLLRKIELASGKKNRKWSKERRVRRKAYIEAIINSKGFKGLIYYSHYTDSRLYIDLTVLSTAKAILNHTAQPYQASVYVDGLNTGERKYFTAGLRSLHVKTTLARGLKDEADEFIRLADAIAGFVRDGIEGDTIMAPLFKQAIKTGVIREV
ncbi:MAG: hypothetical protein A3C02_03375 [Candidatus Andersenbacteria bacterium RIFCSPHIGHO2_02_FULL_45_11]|uniref:DUF3800 domain-containing protein n=1 Tax=Candidatus Andersenbacteria bacterium RIFCSPHIGHO2_12_FULL_45_11 TaxID=1797281 RepID=A0A1G1X4A2_9BACT|nr:MAG: hypothetical protein A2805_03820 [Candidatus Andersenbacteria bacterium RIFCSPHIGHO2_01_FULL_46_36]OGY33478.1 MAG: hypothetical protein A3C02_03375 [Candidatus Andersenbacteria bacterium RIFCSPHIGHO2_02_FULL_45_11]OGY34829.1 MAG: hypothetical protein A3D99_02885 [Candidatus Andersenbacteria bacterium RIFCSPHIGHO2_12_FULL_45_11]